MNLKTIQLILVKLEDCKSKHKISRQKEEYIYLENVIGETVE